MQNSLESLMSLLSRSLALFKFSETGLHSLYVLRVLLVQIDVLLKVVGEVE